MMPAWWMFEHPDGYVWKCVNCGFCYVIRAGSPTTLPYQYQNQPCVPMRYVRPPR